MAVERVNREIKNGENDKAENLDNNTSPKNELNYGKKTDIGTIKGNHSMFKKLFENSGSNDDFKINMENRSCMHCWILPSTLYCSTCMCFYCASCAHANHVSAGSYHDIVSVKHSTLDRSETSGNLQLKQRNMCKRHKNKELKYCCTSCNYLMICETCIIIDGHGSHLLLTLSEAIPRAKQILLQSLSSLMAAAFYMSQKILEVTGSSEQRKNIFESNLLNVEDAQKALTKAINSEEQLLFTELNLLSNKLERGGEDIIQSCINLKEILVSICGEVSIILQLAKESPSHGLNRYVKISNVIKGTLDPTYKVLSPELQHLSVPYWNLNLETINDVLEDTDKYTKEHTDHAIKLSDAIKKIAMGDLSVVEEIGPINVKVYGRNENLDERSKRAKVHKIFTNKLKSIQNDKLKNISNPLTAPKSTTASTAKAKVATKTKNDLKIQEWLGLRNWKGGKPKKSINPGMKRSDMFKLDFPEKHRQNELNVIKALSDAENVSDENETSIEILTIGRDKSLEINTRSKEEKMLSEEYYESHIHFSGIIMGACIYSKGRENMNIKLTKIAIKYCFPFIILYDINNVDEIYSEYSDQPSTILENMNQIKNKSNDINNDNNTSGMPVISPGILKINIPVFFGRVEKPKNALFVADVRQTNIRIQSIHSNSVTPETSKYLGMVETENNAINDGFEISNVMGGNTIEAWVFSCKSFDVAEKWISMLKGEDNDVKSCIFKVGAARLCIKTLSKKGSNVKVGKSNVNENMPLIDIVPKDPENRREKLLLAQSDHHNNKETLVYEDEDGSEYYEEMEIDVPDLMSIRLNRKLSRKLSGSSNESLFASSILKVDGDPVIHIEKLSILNNNVEQKDKQIVMLTKPKLFVISQDVFYKNLSHDVLLDEYSISESVCSTIIHISDKTLLSNIRMLSTAYGNEKYKDNNTITNKFGFEYSTGANKSLVFICPTKQSEIIWMSQIYNSEKKKPLKYWKQILDGKIIRKRRQHGSSSKSYKSSSFCSKTKTSDYFGSDQYKNTTHGNTSSSNGRNTDTESGDGSSLSNKANSKSNSRHSSSSKLPNKGDHYVTKDESDHQIKGKTAEHDGHINSYVENKDETKSGHTDHSKPSDNEWSINNSKKSTDMKKNQTLNVRFDDKFVN